MSQPTIVPLGRNAPLASTINPSERAPFIELRGSILDVGIFRDTLLPSFALHSGLAIAAYGIGRVTNRVETKDWLWPAGMVINAWWASVGRRVFVGGIPAGRVLSTLSRPERLLLTGVTLWGGRLFYRIASRSVARGRDDPRYDAEKQEENYWSKALFRSYLPEAFFQTVITLPFTAPYYHQGGVFTGYHPLLQATSVGLFTAGFVLETLADLQLDAFKASGEDDKTYKEGVWSIVRHPNYLGDALIHFSLPILLYSSDMLAPIELLGPLANYLYLRFVGGDKQNERHRRSSYTGEKAIDFEAYRADKTKNSFWPDAEQLKNKWTWVVVGAGLLGAGIEQLIHQAGLN